MSHLRLVETKHRYEFIAITDEGRVDMTRHVYPCRMTETEAADMAQAIADDEECSVEYVPIEE